MKIPLFAVLVALVASCLSSVAQESPTIEIATYAGLTATVAESGVYNIEATADLSQVGGWSVVETLELKAGEPYLWFDGSPPISGKRFYRVVSLPVQPVPNMVLISPGTFTMGSPETDVDRWDSEGPLTKVNLTKGFFMGRYEVTQAEYLVVMGSNPSEFTGDPSHPVDSVSWNQAVDYCSALTTRERVEGRCPAGWEYRLPTSAEWEYACRAGTRTRLSYGDDPGYRFLATFAWWNRNSEKASHPVGQKVPNPWGLFDMHGNVAEWCMDSSEIGNSKYPGGSVVDPLVTTGANRVLRGGGWNADADEARCAYRHGHLPGTATREDGFRVVLSPSQ